MPEITSKNLLMMLTITLLIALIILFILYYKLHESHINIKKIHIKGLNGIWLSDKKISEEQGLDEIYLYIDADKEDLNVYCIMFDDSDEMIFDDNLCKLNSSTKEKSVDKHLNIICKVNPTYTDVFGDDLIIKNYYNNELMIFSQDKLFGKFKKLDI